MITMREAIMEIIHAGVQAPSGDNCQPWKFIMKGETSIEVFNLPERDTSLYSRGDRASYVAHGALLENMSIAASEMGYELACHMFPDTGKPDFMARIEIRTRVRKEEPLHNEIFRRVTNRKPYAQTPLSSNEKSIILAAGNQRNPSVLYWVDDKEKFRILAEAAAMNEKILLENKEMHHFFFNHINWTKKEDETRSIGLFIKTLELPPPAEIAFKIFSYWPAISLFNMIGASRLVVSQNANVYASSAAFGAIVVPDETRESFIAAGRCMQRIWLTATHLQLSMQPLTGILFLMHGIEMNSPRSLSEKHIACIRQAYDKIKNIFGVRKGLIAMQFRIGKGSDPSAHSLRLPPIIEDTYEK